MTSNQLLTHPRSAGGVIPLPYDFPGLLPRLLPRRVVLAEDFWLGVHPAAGVSAGKTSQLTQQLFV